MNLSKNWMQNLSWLYRNSWQQSTVTGRGVYKENTSWYCNSRTNDYDKWLRKSVYNDKYTFKILMTIVDYVNKNDATHKDMRNMQNWAHLHAVFSVPRLIIHHNHIGSRTFALVFHPISIPSMMCGCLWVSPLHLLLLPAFLFSLLVLLDVRLRRWLRDKQLARLRQRDLRYPGRSLPTYSQQAYEKRFGRESKVHLSHLRHFLHTKFLHQKEPTTRSQVWKITRDVKNTLRRINLQRNAVKRSTTASTTDTSVTKLSGSQWLKWDALNRWS